MNNTENEKPISRTNYDHLARKERIKSLKLLKEHNARVQEIMDFLKDHRVTTMYVLDEINRIKRDHQVKDELREMVTYLERPEREADKELVLSLFSVMKKERQEQNFDVFKKRPNSGIINIIKDPFNDGVVK
ncbi:unnamed protein product [Danaus chrysippus]|nr:unnamed protein product [Danaus chrysippus]